MKEPGCRQLSTAVSQKDPNHVLLFEAWDNAAAFDAFLATVTKGENEVRYFFREDARAAEKVAKDATAALRKLHYANPREIKVVDLIGKQGTKNYSGVVELWLDLPPRGS